MNRLEKTVFISYRRTNRWSAVAIYQDLTSHGYDVFIDYNGIASGNFERIILENIIARAHFLVLLTPSALEHCDNPSDWLRLEVETALDYERNIVPIMLEEFTFDTPEIKRQLIGRLSELERYNALTIPSHYFSEAMEKLRTRYFDVPLSAVLHRTSQSARQAATEQKAAADAAPIIGEDELTAQQFFERGYAATDLDSKLRFYTKAIRLKPDFADALFYRGMARLDANDRDGAKRDSLEVIQQQPDYLQPWGRHPDYSEPTTAPGLEARAQINTPYINSISFGEELPYPGDRRLERRIKSLIRWNAMAMVHRQNKEDAGIGGHISTYSSLATLLEVGFNHFFHASYGDQPGDFIYFQGHASPGVYARAFLEGRLSLERVLNYRHELRDTPGLPSYPHPWLMPDFWTFPTVSLGLGPLNALYQARFMRYLEIRGLIEQTDRKVWAFVGDGETDEPESMGSLTLGAREKLDNLIFVVNCNLQRLDSPVRGNGKIVNELEAAFRGAGWNVIKVLWGSDWDPLLAKDESGLLMKRFEEVVDGELQSYKARGGAYIRKEFFGKYPELLELVRNMDDDQLHRLSRGGHDPQKVYNAYKRAVEHKGQPTVILAQTVKGYGLGSAEARNATHQEKKLADQALTAFRSRFEIPIPEEAAKKGALYRPPDDSPEILYMCEQRRQLGGTTPNRRTVPGDFKAPPLSEFAESLAGSQGRAVSTTMGYVSMLRQLMKDPAVGKYIVPIIPDEGRTFGMESIIRQVGIYASQGQLYRPHDTDMLLYYREEKNGQILEEGVNEAGSMASMTAAGTAYSSYGVPTIPFFTYYSMFGFQRVGDMIWAFADARGRGFLVGGTAGRTTLAGEGLQHQDGHSLVLASTVPTCHAYDPVYVYEIAVIVQDGMRRMFEQNQDRFYYITAYNEDYAMPEMPQGVEEGVLHGIYRYKAAEQKAVIQLFGSGPMLNEALKAQQTLAEKYGVHADVWSVTSYNELRRDALAIERWNRLHPAELEKRPYILQALEGAEGSIVAATDYMKAVPDQLAPWLAGRLVSLGTDGFGRSDNRQHLRRHFEVSADSISATALSRLARDGDFDRQRMQTVFAELGIDTETIDPATA